MNISKVDSEIITQISNKNSENYVDLPSFYKQFQYPVSLEFSKQIGQKAYQEEAIDPLEFFHILVNKVYTSIIETRDISSLAGFILNEREGFTEKARKLIRAVKKWELELTDDATFAKEIESFCMNTQSVRLPVVSFFLRLMLPNKFGTLDVHAVNALRLLGFESVKEIPSEERDKSAYFRKYPALEYLQYNSILKDIGRHFDMATDKGLRTMSPSEVDMALYVFDKREKRGMSPKPSTLDSKGKIERIMGILEDIADDVREVANMSWAIKGGYSGMMRSSAEKLMKIMRGYAQRGDMEGMYTYYVSALGDSTGKRVGDILRQCGKKSLESEYPKVKQIYSE